MQRRDFLKFTGLLPAMHFAPATYAAGADWSRILVLIELNGGNDGLNTVVPYTDPHYYTLRPRLAVARDSVLPLSEQLGFHPALEALMPAWHARELAVVLGVGYPDPNRSHFRSIEIWDTASDARQTLTDGWLARLFASSPPPAGHVAHGVALGSGLGPLAGGKALAINEPQQLLRQAARLPDGPHRPTNPALTHLLAVRTETRRAADVLQERLAQPLEAGAAFPATRLGRQLEMTARLLAGRVPIAAIKLAHGGFDTHSRQRAIHDRLLKELAEGLAAFRQAMQRHGLWQRVLVLTYSEFGRRAQENGSAGTDHGTAAPHILLGGRVRGGFHGAQPSLDRLADGDLVHRVDFRQLYLTVAQRWWGVHADFLAGHTLSPLDCLA
jgi:uncharacterized protein (DUF1501 family)